MKIARLFPKLSLLLLILSIISFKSFAQKSTRDSMAMLLKDETNDTVRSRLLNNLAFLYLESHPDTAMHFATQSLQFARQGGSEIREAISLNQIGNVYSMTGNYPKALSFFLMALRLNEKIKHSRGKQHNLGNVGTVYNNMGDYRTALAYLFKAKELGEETYDQNSSSVNLVNISYAYLGLKIYDSAILYAQQANSIASKINYDRIIGSSYGLLGEIYTNTGKISLAVEYYRLSLPFLVNAENYTYISTTYLGIAKAFQQKDSVISYATKAFRIARERGFILEMRDAARFLSLYYRKHNADSAFYYQDVSRAANDSLFSQNKQKEVQTLAFDETIRQSELQAAESKARLERKHNLQYAAIAFFLVIFIISFFVFSHSIIANQRLIKFLGIMALLIVFEFLNLLLHPYIGNLTHHSPVLMLMIMVGIAALLIPLHHKLEHWITHRLVEKNKKIRLAAAKKIIATLEPEPVN